MSFDFSAAVDWFRNERMQMRQEAKEKKRVVRRPRKKYKKRHAMLLRSGVAKALDSGVLPVRVREHLLKNEGVSKCQSCLEVKDACYFQITSGKLRANCIKCSRKRYNENPELWFCENLVKEAKKRCDLVTITGRWCFQRLNELDKRCELCGLSVTTLRPERRGESRMFRKYTTNLSLDQRRPSAGYTEDNVQLVHLRCNLAKLDMEQEEFLEMCRLVSAHFRLDTTTKTPPGQ